MKMVGASSMFRMAAIVAAVLVAVLISTSEASYYPPPSDELLHVEAITCNSVILEITPCRGYIAKTRPDPTKACCNGVKDIYDKVKTRPDRVEACKCIKRALSVVGSYDPNRIPLIPTKCGLPFSLPAIRADTDCNKVVSPGF